MKRFILSAAAVLGFLPCTLHAQSTYFNTSKSVEIFHSVIRDLSLYYVDSVEVDKLVYTGINAMLESLDPYTVLIPEEETESLEIMTTGSYGGVGALIKKRDGEGVQISEPYKDSPAHKAGLVAGDVILEIDSQSVLPLSADECSARMKGTPGTDVVFTVKKLLGQDTVRVNVTRQKVHVSDVGLACLLQDSIAYLRITGFTQGGSKEVRQALQTLSAEKPVKGIIIDLRDNGGGLMDEAVKMLSIFLPKNTMVVTARGRDQRFDVAYYTKEEPFDTKTPLVVLVNGGSASSSEIFAGAIQDLKRGQLVGERTFGKGLVQSIRPLSYNANLKITTAKYYIPSGRCVQAIDYAHRSEDGRPDKDQNGGILPDQEVKGPTYSRIAMELVARDYLHDFSVDYYARHRTLVPAAEFQMSDQDYEDFVAYVSDKEFDDRSATEIVFDQLIRIAKEESYDALIEQEMTNLKGQLLTSKAADLRHYRNEIQPLLEEEICCRYYYQEGRLRNLIKNDVQLEKALVLFEI